MKLNARLLCQKGGILGHYNTYMSKRRRHKDRIKNLLSPTTSKSIEVIMFIFRFLIKQLTLSFGVQMQGYNSDAAPCMRSRDHGGGNIVLLCIYTFFSLKNDYLVAIQVTKVSSKISPVIARTGFSFTYSV